MHNVTMILFDTNELDHDGNYGEPKSIEHFVLMEFTGRKDKKEKDIYDGDIIKHPLAVDPEDTGWVVLYKDFGFKADLIIKAPYLYPILLDLSDLNTEEMEIIGNIYENTELL